jgi:hypothetical protein
LIKRASNHVEAMKESNKVQLLNRTVRRTAKAVPQLHLRNMYVVRRKKRVEVVVVIVGLKNSFSIVDLSSPSISSCNIV